MEERTKGNREEGRGRKYKQQRNPHIITKILEMTKFNATFLSLKTSFSKYSSTNSSITMHQISQNFTQKSQLNKNMSKKMYLCAFLHIILRMGDFWSVYRRLPDNHLGGQCRHYSLMCWLIKQRHQYAHISGQPRGADPLANPRGTHGFVRGFAPKMNSRDRGLRVPYLFGKTPRGSTHWIYLLMLCCHKVQL